MIDWSLSATGYFQRLFPADIRGQPLEIIAVMNHQGKARCLACLADMVSVTDAMFACGAQQGVKHDIANYTR